MKNKIECVYIIQPILDEKYMTLQQEAVALIESAGGSYSGTIYQTIKEVNPATYIGRGKVIELNERLRDLEVTILFNGSLSPSQTLNLSAALSGKKVIDRTTLILDIFARNAVTAEGKLQVELAQLNYLYPRLKGKGSALSRLGGGIGTRGPGETQLETDRRYIRSRIQNIKLRLSELEEQRKHQTERRKKNFVKTIALVGYTNTGKSTLLNLLTNADVYVKNQLFATLDPTVRKFNLDGLPTVLIDTVGFLQDLPHELIQAFHSTLESVIDCDLALIVCDATGEYDMQLSTTLETLQRLHFSSPYLVVMNKSENIAEHTLFPYESILISAKEELGIANLKLEIRKQFEKDYIWTSLYIPYDKQTEFSLIEKYLYKASINFTDFGQEIGVVIPKIYAHFFSNYEKRG